MSARSQATWRKGWREGYTAALKVCGLDHAIVGVPAPPDRREGVLWELIGVEGLPDDNLP